MSAANSQTSRMKKELISKGKTHYNAVERTNIRKKLKNGKSKDKVR